MKRFLNASIACVVSTTRHAATVTPTEYQMQNGQGSGFGGSFSYRDESYDGPGAPTGTELATLTGGTGDLTDGVIATRNWNSAGQTSSTAYVAWISIDPRITFSFANVQGFNTATFYFDVSFQGGVAPPTGVEVTDTLLSSVPTQSSAAPFAHVVDLTSIAPTDTLTFDIFRQLGRWVFLSEVTFDAAPVPLPASELLLLGAMGGLGAWRRKRG